jgi:RNA polymerase sigma factor (sigma-70 family)
MTKLDPLEAILFQLSSGDAEAIQSVFKAYELYLRMVVRKQLSPPLRAKFDSLDIVQSVWADLLKGFQAGSWKFSSPAQLRAFLVKVTRNRLIDRVRQQQTPLRFERRLNETELMNVPQARQTAVGGQMEAAEMWQRLMALCPAKHRRLLELKRQGLSLVEIAARSDLHEGSVRRIFYELAANLAVTGRH